MPLAFLTADRAFDQADDVALPFDDRDQWRRPYRPGPWRVGAAALLLLLASYMLLAAMIIALADAPSAGAACGIGALLVIVASLRLLRVGTWVSARGVRRVGFFATRTVPWDQVASVRTTQQPVRWLGLPRTVQGQAVLLVPGQGKPLTDPLMTSHNGDFLGRPEAFERAADTVEAWAYEYRQAR
ncbi:PH domain-containing protein [Streptomyces sp. TRM66268-LWL]|uniref:PH domain-containing protein n=1 Tax=Streptomyces polyasparticus TaxID=2767826 RepID=A0ABR7S8I9_9ACTN|nr:PH domain-containing protein [Streptomyces polyasparticus]MBC9711781.1 PH domain-containing protein [Streptomyces polyasparticus]